MFKSLSCFLLIILFISNFAYSQTIVNADWNLDLGKELHAFAVVARTNSIYKINLSNGNVSKLGSLGFKINQSSLAFDNKGTLWGFSLKPKKIKTSHLQYALLYKVDLETGKGEVVKEFNISNLGRGAGLEFSKDTQKLYWSSAKGLYELNIKRGMAIKRLTFTKRGTFCLARNSEGNFMGIENNTLVEIDVLKKKITQKVKLNIPRSKRRVPSLLVLNDGKIFFSFKKKMYYMKDLNSKLVNLGPIDVNPWGLALLQ